MLGLTNYASKHSLIYAIRHLWMLVAICLTRSDSWKDVAWYWAYLAMVVRDRLLSHRHCFLVLVASQFSSAGWHSCVRTSTRCSGLASTRVLVENRPKSKEMSKEREWTQPNLTWGKSVSIFYQRSTYQQNLYCFFGSSIF